MRITALSNDFELKYRKHFSPSIFLLDFECCTPQEREKEWIYRNYLHPHMLSCLIFEFCLVFEFSMLVLRKRVHIRNTKKCVPVILSSSSIARTTSLMYANVYFFRSSVISLSLFFFELDCRVNVCVHCYTQQKIQWSWSDEIYSEWKYDGCESTANNKKKEKSKIVRNKRKPIYIQILKVLVDGCL